MKKHFWRILTVLLMACLGMGVLAACGDGEEPENPPAPPAETNPYEGIWTGASATDFIMSGTQTVSAAVDFVEGQAHEGYVVATITGSGANAETYYAAFGIDKDGETYKGDLFFGDDTVEVTLSLANNQLKAVVPSFEEGEDPTTLTFTSRNATLPAAISPTGTLYGSDEFADTIFTFDFTNKKFYVGEAEQTAKFINVANYVVIETVQGTGSEAFTACLIVYQKGTAYHCNGIGDDMELSTTTPAPATYTVTFDDGEANGAATDMPSVNGNAYHENDELQLPETEPQWQGHDFTGWKASTDQEIYDAGALYTFTDSDVTFTAQWSPSTPAPATYTVQFEQGAHGTLTNGDPVSGKEADEAVTLPTVTPATGYTFDGWYQDGTKVVEPTATTYSVNAEHAVSGTITLTAHYTPKQYTVTLNVGTNGTLAGGAEATVTATYDQSVTLPTVTANKGYTFDGWYTEATAGTKFNSGDTWQTDGTELKLYARYNYIEYTVEYVKGNEGDVQDMPTDVTAKVSLEEGHTTITLPTTEPKLAGHVFDGWKVGSQNAVKSGEITITAADLPENDAEHKITVTATWHEEGKLSVTYELGDHAAEQETPTQADVVSGTQIDLPAAPTAAKGYRFDAWYVKDDAGSNTKAGDAQGQYEVKDANVTIIAKYEPIKYTVKFDKGEGTVEGNIADVTDFTIEGEINLSEKTGYTRTGYTLKGWTSGSTTLNANETFKLSGHEELIPAATEDGTEITLTAKWTAKTYTVTLEAGANGTLTDNTVQATYDAPLDLSEKTPTPAAGYTFKGWFTQATAGEQFTSGSNWTTDGTDLKLYAQYDAIEYVVKYSQGAGVSDAEGMPQADGKIAHGAPLTLPADPTRTGYTFAGWQVAGKEGTVKNGETLTLDDSIIAQATDGTEADQGKKVITLTATWTKDDVLYTFNFYENKDDEEAKTTKTETLADGANVGSETVETAISKANYTFDGWYYEKNSEEHEFDETFVPSEYGSTTIKVYAHWKLNDEITLDDITATDYTGDVPLYTYEGGLHKGDAVTISGDLTFTKGASALVHEGILGYFSQGDGITGTTKKYIIARYDYCFNNTSATKAPQGGDNQDAMPELKWTLTKHVVAFSKIAIGDWFAAYSALIMRAGVTFEFELEYDYTTEGVVFISYVIKNPTEFTYTYGDAGANSQTVPAGSEFIMRYAVTASEGQLADDFVIALGGEQAKLANVTLKRVQNAHIHTGTDTCEVCGKTLVKSDVQSLTLAPKGTGWAEHIAEQTTGDYTAAPGRDLHITGEFGTVGADWNGFAIVIAEKTSKIGLFCQYSSGSVRTENSWTLVDPWNIDKRIVNGGFASLDALSAETKSNHKFELILTYDGVHAKLTIITYSDAGVTAADTRTIICNIKGSEMIIGLGLDGDGTTENVKNVKYFTVTAQDAAE